jgi:hypothetical protein
MKRLPISLLPVFMLLGLFLRTSLLNRKQYNYFSCSRNEVDKVLKAKILVLGTSHVRYFPKFLQDKPDWAAVSTPGSLLRDNNKFLRMINGHSSYSIIIRPLHKVELKRPLRGSSQYFKNGINGRSLIAECSQSVAEKVNNNARSMIEVIKNALGDVVDYARTSINPSSIKSQLKDYASNLISGNKVITANYAKTRLDELRTIWDLSEDSSDIEVFLEALPVQAKCIIFVDSPITKSYESYHHPRMNSTTILDHLRTSQKKAKHIVYYLSIKDLNIHIPATRDYYDDGDHLSEKGSLVYLEAIRNTVYNLNIIQNCAT